MSNLVRSELLKLKTVATTEWLLAAMVLLSVLDVGLIVLTAGPSGSLHLDDPDLLARSLGGAAAGEVIVLVLGILVLSHEFRFGTATATFLATPRRANVLAAKAAAVAIIGAAFGAASSIAVLGLAVTLIRARGGVLIWDRDVVEVLLAVVFVMGAFAVLGLALATVIRNHIAAIVGAVAWLFVVEQLLLGLYPSIGRWTPGGATAGALQLGRVATTRGALLPAWAAGLVLIAYAVALLLIGGRRIIRADITESR
jgi:ABC-type transport system involved in multi-copper enzyme maturation permease subunit